MSCRLQNLSNTSWVSSDGSDECKCCITLSWHASDRRTEEEFSGGNQTADIWFWAVLCEQQTGCDVDSLLIKWRPATIESKTETCFPPLDPRVQKHFLDYKRSCGIRSWRTMSRRCERATSTENKQLLAVLAHWDSPPTHSTKVMIRKWGAFQHSTECWKCSHNIPVQRQETGLKLQWTIISIFTV